MSETILPLNTLIQYSDETEKNVLRLIFADYLNDIGFTINIYSAKGIPVFCRPSILAEDISSKEAFILDDDPWARIINEDELSEKEKSIRDKAWDIVEDLIKPENEPQVFTKKGRGNLINEIAQKKNTTALTVYKYWRKYLQRGKVKNALLPDYEKSGNKEKGNFTSNKKLGRKRKFQHIESIGEGVNVDEKIKKIFRTAISQFYYNPRELTLKKAYDLMLSKYFAEDFTFNNGIKEPLLIQQDQKPTYSQFLYFYNKERNIEKETTSRKGKSAYALNNRPLLGSATNEVIGPGLRYEIDATVADVYLVSRFNRNWIIGRPIVYVVIDVFSRMIAGVYVGLEGPSWLGATMALVNTATDKVSFCKEYELEINKAEWACSSLPATILADGGELAGKAVETLATNLNIKIETASPYRGDLKGIVERNFRSIHEKVKPFLPGYVIKNADKRRGVDYRLDAKLDIYQFTQIILAGILQHNQSFLSYYKRDAEMVAKNVKATPNELWKWGIENRKGIPRHFPEDIVKLNLLPTGSARVSRSGILFKQMRYSCESAIKENWFEKDGSQSGKSLKIVYDMRKFDYIYLRNNDGRGFEKCYLLETESKYVNRDYYEIEHYHNQEKLDNQLNLSEAQQNTSDHAAFTRGVVAEAEKLYKVKDTTASNSSKILNIRDNRKIERDGIRENEAFELGKTENTEKSAKIISLESKQIINLKDMDGVDEFNLPDELELLMQIRNKQKWMISDDDK
jgi:Integrase core domain/Mu transposase, C-terminal